MMYQFVPIYSTNTVYRYISVSLCFCSLSKKNVGLRLAKVTLDTLSNLFYVADACSDNDT